MTHPREFAFEVDTPLHGAAWWAAVDVLAEPGKMAVIEARAENRHEARFALTNVAQLGFLPDPEVFDIAEPLQVFVNGRCVFEGRISMAEELIVSGDRTAVQPRREVSPTAWCNHPVAEAPELLDMLGTEARLANWITDAMRQATAADLALYNRRHYRGLPIRSGSVDIVDLIQCSRPFDQYLVTVRLQGREVIEILEANVADADRLVQLSGARYTFDRRRPAGQRLVWSSLEPEHLYTVVLEGQVVERETILLAGRFKKLEYQTTAVPFTMALYGHAAKLKRVEARAEGRVREQ